jgi:GT2 family glycosyltransferase
VKPLVSILVPAHNAQDWIGDTLRSAIAQTWQRQEIIVVDDGSTDRTLAVARGFESNNVKVVTQENQGAAATRNACFSLSSGGYIQWLDADDLLASNKLTLQLEAVERHRLGPRTLLSSGWAPFLYRHRRAAFVPTALWCDLSPVEWLLRKMGQNLHMQTATWLVSRELTEAAGPWDPRLVVDDDGEYFCRVLLASEGVRFVRETGVYYRQSGTSSVSYVGRSEPKMLAQWQSMQMHIGYLRSLEDSERTRAASVRYLQTWLPYFYPERPDLVEKVQALANELGGHLEVPRLSWKYSWIETLCGPAVAKRAQIQLQNVKAAVVRRIDRLFFEIDVRANKAGANLP